MKRLALLGAGGHGKVVFDMALMAGWDEVVFFDDAWPQLQRNGQWGVNGTGTDLIVQLDRFDGVVVSIGHCKSRFERQRELIAAGAHMSTVIHPSASVSRYASLGRGTVVMAGAVVNVDAAIGEAGIVNTGATVDHDCQLADAVHVCPGAHLSGDVQVGACSWIGVGAVVRQGLVIGSNVVVGAGSVVVANVDDGLTVVGNPSRPIRTRAV